MITRRDPKTGEIAVTARTFSVAISEGSVRILVDDSVVHEWKPDPKPEARCAMKEQFVNFPDDLWKEIRKNAAEIPVSPEKYIIEAVRYAMIAAKSGTMFRTANTPSPRSRPARRGSR